MFESTAKFDSSLTGEDKIQQKNMFESTAKFDSSLTDNLEKLTEEGLRVLLNLILLLRRSGYQLFIGV